MVRIMGGEEHAVSGFCQSANFVHYLPLIAEVEAGCRLIEHHELRLLCESARQQHKLPLTARDHGVRTIGESCDTETIEHGSMPPRGRARSAG